MNLYKLLDIVSTYELIAKKHHMLKVNNRGITKEQSWTQVIQV